MHLKVVSLDRTYGPVPMGKLVKLATQGRIVPDDLVRPTDSDVWVRVADVPALAAVLPQPVAVYADDAGPESIDMADEAGGGWEPLPEREVEQAEMDMAPMIDVTFLLLIFFMLTNSLANPSPMNTPEAVHGRGVTLEGQQLILIDEEGDYYLGNTASDDARAESFEAMIEEVQQNAESVDAPLDVIISGHKQTKYVRVRELVERLGSLENIGRVMLGVEEAKFR